jgi:hypothetical protein
VTDREHQIAKLFRESVLSIILAFKPLLLADNQQPDDVDLWAEVRTGAFIFKFSPLINLQSAVREMKENRIQGVLIWRYSTAVRGNGPWQEKMEKPRPLEDSNVRLVAGRKSSSDGRS